MFPCSCHQVVGWVGFLKLVYSKFKKKLSLFWFDFLVVKKTERKKNVDFFFFLSKSVQIVIAFAKTGACGLHVFFNFN